jgi:hypothetical protein
MSTQITPSTPASRAAAANQAEPRRSIGLA